MLIEDLDSLPESKAQDVWGSNWRVSSNVKHLKRRWELMSDETAASSDAIALGFCNVLGNLVLLPVASTYSSACLLAEPPRIYQHLGNLHSSVKRFL